MKVKIKDSLGFEIEFDDLGLAIETFQDLVKRSDKLNGKASKSYAYNKFILDRLLEESTKTLKL